MNQTLFSLRTFLAVFLSLSGFMLAPQVRAQEQEAPTLSSLQLEFDVQRAELTKPARELQKKYAEQLNQLMDQVTEAGNLEEAIAVKAELEGFKGGDSKPADDKFPELKRLQKIYADAYAKRLAVMNKKLEGVFESHKTKLLALQTRLTKEKKLEEALIVKAEIARVDELAKTGQDLAAVLPEPAENLKVTGAAPNQVALWVRASRGWEGLAENVISFRGPKGDGRSGAAGILVKSAGGAAQGSTWMFHYVRAGSAHGLQIIHPRGKGHAIVHIEPEGIGISIPGEWRNVGYGHGDTSDVRTKDGFEDVFPLEDDREYAIASRMDSNGSCEIFVDGKLVATARAKSAKPLNLKIPKGTKIPGGSGWAELLFDGEGFPLEWEEDWAGILVGPLDGGKHLCREVRYSPGIASVSQ